MLLLIQNYRLLLLLKKEKRRTKNIIKGIAEVTKKPNCIPALPPDNPKVAAYLSAMPLLTDKSETMPKSQGPVAHPKSPNIASKLNNDAPLFLKCSAAILNTPGHITLTEIPHTVQAIIESTGISDIATTKYEPVQTKANIIIRKSGRILLLTVA